ncbi:MAG: hypothetical protein SFU25_01975 [Candidatus Caenarcaniphilales bacterium]|nr:hypothetical protein [Candidatus Caenarcaniphilales bacterium]
MKVQFRNRPQVIQSVRKHKTQGIFRSDLHAQAQRNLGTFVNALRALQERRSSFIRGLYDQYNVDNLPFVQTINNLQALSASSSRKLGLLLDALENDHTLEGLLKAHPLYETEINPRIQEFEKSCPPLGFQARQWANGLATLTPESMKLINPVSSYSMSNLRGSGAVTTINRHGDIIRTLLPGDGIFWNLELTNKSLSADCGGDLDLDVFRVTERLPDGTMEQYGLATSSQNPETQVWQIHLLCGKNTMETINYGDAQQSVIWPSNLRKPVLSLRDFNEETEIGFKVNFLAGEYKVIYPLPDTQHEKLIEWKGRALPDNYVKVKDKKYPYLFWDGQIADPSIFEFYDGFCVSRGEVIEFLEQKCSEYGFDEALTTDFVTFWAPYLMENEYSLVRFLTPKECQELAELNIECEKEVQVVRFYMLFTACDGQVEIQEQKTPQIILENKPKVFDWGGFSV